MLERLLRRYWGLGAEPVELVVGALESPPARTLTEIFHDAVVTVCCGGLEVYGPVRELLPKGVGSRVERVLYLPLVPDLPPRMLADYGVVHEVLPRDAFTKVLDEVMADAGDLVGRVPTGFTEPALIIGQRMADLESPEGWEEQIHADMLRGLVARGHREVAFVPAPDGQGAVAARLADDAGRLGIDLVVLDDPVPTEVWCAALRPTVTVGVFPPAMARVARLLDMPAMAFGLIQVLERLNPYDHAERVPATIVDAIFPRLTNEGGIVDPPIASHETEERLVPLLAAVTYCMQPGRYPELRESTARYVDALPPGPALRRYLRRQRLVGLGLVQAPPPPGQEAGDAGGTLQRFTQRLKERIR